MLMMMKDGEILIQNPSEYHLSIIRSWSLLTWSKKNQWWHGPISLELLDKLSRLVTLPRNIEAERQHLHAVQNAVDAERLKPAEEVRPYREPPVKKTLYTHQIRAMNMALLTFGLVDPEEVKKRTSP